MRTTGDDSSCAASLVRNRAPISSGEAAARSQHTEDLRKGRRLVRSKAQGPIRDDDVEREVHGGVRGRVREDKHVVHADLATEPGVRGRHAGGSFAGRAN